MSEIPTGTPGPATDAGDANGQGSPAPTGDTLLTGQNNTPDSSSSSNQGQQGATPETNAGDTSADAAGGDAAGNADQTGNTETDTASYDYAIEDFSLPEGVTLDPDAFKSFSDIAKSAKLGKEQAGELVNLGVKMMQSWQTHAVEQQKNTVNGWIESSKNDPEFGGESFEQNLSIAHHAMKAFGNDQLKAILNDTGLGNHPEVVRAFIRAGKAVMEDGFVPGSGIVSSQPLSYAQAMYSQYNQSE